MTLLGSFVLFLALVSAIISAICALLGGILASRADGRRQERGDQLLFASALTAYLSAASITFCCVLLVYCFMSGDVSLDYVVNNQSHSTGALAWLYKLSGLWAGREGSLLFWAWLISLFNVFIGRKLQKSSDALDGYALAVAQLVLAAFLAVMVFSPENTPFEALDPQYFNEDGSLNSAASLLGMNVLLEHWAMAIHPPTLFVGYAGMTVPFAYAVAAIIANDKRSLWAERCRGCTLFAWLFLTLGIGLGAVWAYVVLGWGGYWGWDPVENASLLPWLLGLALIHSFSMLGKRRSYKLWSVFCACLSFSFVILGTFISRSGLLNSVHAFQGDSVSTALFLVLILASLGAGIVGLILRRKDFAPDKNVPQADSLASRDVAFYANNLFMLLAALLLAYLTLAPALPQPLPLAGKTVSTGTFNAIARPLGILYFLLMAICPLLSWCKTERADFLRRIKLPAAVAALVFALLMLVFFLKLQPNYAAAIAKGGSVAAAYTDYGPAWYYNSLAIAGLFTASLLVCTAMSKLLGAFHFGDNKLLGAFHFGDKPRHKAVNWGKLGAYLSHSAAALLLVGLIGSSMYVAEDLFYLDYDSESKSCSESIVQGDYELVFTGQRSELLNNDADLRFVVCFEVFKDGRSLGTLEPSMQVHQATLQQSYNAAVLSLPAEDIFLVFQGLDSEEGRLVMDLRVNPLIGCVWAGIAFMGLGIGISCASKFGRRSRGGKSGGKQEKAAESQEA